MQVKLKNTGDGLRIVYDQNTVQRPIRPGQEITLEISQVNARRYEQAEEKGDTLSITLIDKYDPEVDAAEKAVRLPTPDDQRNSVPMSRTPLPRDHNFTARESMGGDQPRTRREADDGGPIETDAERAEREALESGDEALTIATGQGDDATDKDDGKAAGRVERVKIKDDKRPDRIAAVAKNAGKEKPQAPKPKGKPKTAGELLAVLDDLEPGEIIELANAVLPKGKLPVRPKLSQVNAALRAQAQSDAKKAKAKGE